MTSRSLGTLLLVVSLATPAVLAAQARPSGPAVSFTKAQADSGRVEFGELCSECHSGDLTGGEGPPLNGGMFRSDFGGKPVKELSSFIQESMPRTSPGSLEPASVARLVAFLLSANGVAPGTQPLTPSSTAIVPTLRRPR